MLLPPRVAESLARPILAVEDFLAASKNYVTGADIPDGPAKRTRRTNAFAAAVAATGIALCAIGYVSHERSVPVAFNLVHKP